MTSKCYETLEILFLCIFIDVFANNELKIRFIGRDFCCIVFLVFDTLKIQN